MTVSQALVIVLWDFAVIWGGSYVTLQLSWQQGLLMFHCVYAYSNCTWIRKGWRMPTVMLLKLSFIQCPVLGMSFSGMTALLMFLRFVSLNIIHWLNF